MGELLHAEGKLKAALLTYFEVCYLGLNGAQNRRPCVSQPHVSTDFPVFNAKRAKLAGTVLKRCLELAGSLQLNGPDLREWFYRAVTQPYCDLRLPVEPQGAWQRLKQRMRVPAVS